MKKFIYLLILFLTTNIVNSQTLSTAPTSDSTSIFFSKPNTKWHPWTITTKFGHMLQMAESWLGERDKSYTILGIEISNKQYPERLCLESQRHVIVQITEDCLYDMNRAVFQVAHEAIHCLSPTEGRNSNVLEEGLANFFAVDYCKKFMQADRFSELESYTRATKLVVELLNYDNDIVKKIRKHQPTISKIDKELILKINPNIPKSLAIELTKKFER